MKKWPKTLRILGIMSGTSLDGVDFALCEIKEKKLPSSQLLSHHEREFPRKLRERLQTAARDELKVSELTKLHYDLGRFYGEQVADLKRSKAMKLHAVGLHGQTVFHAGRQATLQIGEASFVRTLAQVPVVTQFRNLDVSLGGEGAPLAPFFHQSLLQELHPGTPVAFHNLGGISNTTWIGPRRNKLIAFDTGPANMLMDLVVRRVTNGRKLFDQGGSHARLGIPDLKLLQRFMAHSYLKKPAPKSCGREEFGELFLMKHAAGLNRLNLEDQLSTLAEFTAASIERAYRDLVPRLPAHVYASGGGAKNGFLIERIRRRLSEVSWHTSDELGWSASAIEAGAFAWLAACRLWEIPLDLPSVTGASARGTLGQVII